MYNMQKASVSLEEPRRLIMVVSVSRCSMSVLAFVPAFNMLTAPAFVPAFSMWLGAYFWHVLHLC